MAQIIAKPKDRLREALNDSGLTQVELARKANLTKDKVNKYLKGVCKPGNVPMFNMSQVLNVSPLWLMGYDVPKREDNEMRQIKNEIMEKLNNLEVEKLKKVKRFIDEFID